MRIDANCFSRTERPCNGIGSEHSLDFCCCCCCCCCCCLPHFFSVSCSLFFLSYRFNFNKQVEHCSGCFPVDRALLPKLNTRPFNWEDVSVTTSKRIAIHCKYSPLTQLEPHFPVVPNATPTHPPTHPPPIHTHTHARTHARTHIPSITINCPCRELVESCKFDLIWWIWWGISDAMCSMEADGKKSGWPGSDGSVPPLPFPRQRINETCFN